MHQIMPRKTTMTKEQAELLEQELEIKLRRLKVEIKVKVLEVDKKKRRRTEKAQNVVTVIR